jgi:hypothetical protein
MGHIFIVYTDWYYKAVLECNVLYMKGTKCKQFGPSASYWGLFNWFKAIEETNDIKHVDQIHEVMK